MGEIRQIGASLARLHARREEGALATVVGIRGSTYRRPGARLLISGDGQLTGSLSGGCLERDVVRRAVRVMSSGVPEVVVYDSTLDDPDEGFALGCNGVVEILIERIGADGGPIPFLEGCVRARRVGSV